MAERSRRPATTPWRRKAVLEPDVQASCWRLPRRGPRARPRPSGGASCAPTTSRCSTRSSCPLVAAPAHHLRGQGRVHGQLEDQVPLPGAGHDPDRPLGRQRRRAGARRRGRRARRGRAASASTRGHPVAATACCTGPHRPGPPGAAHRRARSSRSASGARARSSRPTRSCPKPFRRAHPLRPADRRRPLPRPRRRPPACCARSSTR